jgi:hypothetical protein
MRPKCATIYKGLTTDGSPASGQHDTVLSVGVPNGLQSDEPNSDVWHAVSGWSERLDAPRGSVCGQSITSETHVARPRDADCGEHRLVEMLE